MEKIKISTRGSKDLTYEFLIRQLTLYRGSFLSLKYAQGIMMVALREGLVNKDYNPFFQGYAGNVIDFYEKNIVDQTKFFKTELQKDIIDDVFKDYQNTFGTNEDAIRSINFQNYHFLRGRFINCIFEVLNKYISRYESQFGKTEGRKVYLRTQLQKKDWYVMLYILRNNASHADGLHTEFDLPYFLKDSKKTSFTWRTISVTKGMFAYAIRYNDEELLLLYEDMMSFIKLNYELFTHTNTKDPIPALIS